MRGFLHWLRGPGRLAPPAEQQRRFTVIRLQFNDVLSQFDLFTEVITQRSEHETGVWLSGLDVAAWDALSLPGGYFEPPPVICYLARGPGAAIRRARTRLPGGGRNPVAIIRVPRERMVGHGSGSTAPCPGCCCGGGWPDSCGPSWTPRRGPCCPTAWGRRCRG